MIGLTGGIGSGKSTVSDMLRERGLPVVDADRIAREMMEEAEVVRRVSESFGEGILNGDGKVDRRKLRREVFEDKHKLQKLNAIFHGQVEARMRQRVETLCKEGHKLIILDVPLLIENNLVTMVDKVWLVACGRETQIERIMKRDGSSREEALRIMEKQMPLDEKRRFADRIIENDASLEELEDRVERALGDVLQGFKNTLERNRRMKELKTLKDVEAFKIEDPERISSASHEEIKCGATTDIYFIRTMDILKSMGLADKPVVAEIFARKDGCFAGLGDVKALLKGKNIEWWSLQEGDTFKAKEPVMIIKGAYSEFGAYETTLLGMLASACGWATAAREVKEACGEKTFLCFGARHLHPAVAPCMERAAVVGGASGASCILAAKEMGMAPSGTLPHAAMLIAGDTELIAEQYDKLMPLDHKRIVLVDTFKDEVEESIRIARLLGDRLFGVRVDTPSERGGVTPGLIRELRAKLDYEGFQSVKIFVSGGLTPEKIRILSEAGADSFGVGSYISSASPIDMTMDLKEVDGKPIAKRGRIPGIVENKNLKKATL